MITSKLFPSTLYPLAEKDQRRKRGRHNMISVLAQERLLGAALGSTFTGIVVFEQRKSIYKSISEIQPQSLAQSEVRDPVFEKKSRFQFAHTWNRAVDQTLGPVIESLSSRGW